MPVDANIFQQYLQAPKSVSDYSADMDKAESNKLTLAASRLAGQQAQQGMADDQAVRQAYQQSGGDQNKLLQILQGGGQYKAGQAVQKTLLENQKARADIDLSTAHAGKFGADTKTAEFELQNKKHDDAIKELTGFQTPQQAIESVKRHTSSGALAPDQAQAVLQSIPQDPAQFAAWQMGKLRNLLTAKEQIAQISPDANAVLSAKTSTDNNSATNATSRANNASSNATTMRGQNMTDGRARETLEAGKQQIVQTDNGPVLVNTRTGAGRVVNGPDGQPLPGTAKPLNDGQSKALLFGSRMREADKVLATLSAEGKVNSLSGSRASYVGGAINAMSSDNNQMLNQAKTDFMTAVLRRESGAAISSGEFDTADKQYFPQIGDSPGVIAQKANNRQLAMRGILMEVPEKQRNSLQPSGAASGMPSDIASILQKHGGK